MMQGIYMMFYHRHDRTTYVSMVLVFVALVPFPLAAPFNYLIKIIVLIGLYFLLKRSKVEQKKLMIVSAILFLLFMYLGNVFGLILGKVMSYVSTGTASEGLHFYGVHQTIREAGKIPFETFANRISGSQIGVLIAFVGYVTLVIRHRSFILALPLMGIGAFALLGGLRFTVYAVPVAAMSAIYLFFILGDFFKDKKLKYTFIVFATAMMIYPNITHILGYKVPTVLNKTEVSDLDKLKQVANPKDYTLTWWDYGYPIWYYSETSTLIDGGKHQNDNFIISTIMQTSSSTLAANLSRLAVETYAEGVDSYDKYIDAGKDESKIAQKFKMFKKDGDAYHAGKSSVINHLLRNAQEDQLDPNMFLYELENNSYNLPKKTRDIYLYMPYRMLSIFPTVAVFGNLDLITGKPLRKIAFYPTSARKTEKGIITLQNGIVFDSIKGKVNMGSGMEDVQYFIATKNTKDNKITLQSQKYNSQGKYAVIYMQSYGRFVVMDIETFNSMYVQMFILGKYDKNLFELVISSPYSRIYKLKI